MTGIERNFLPQPGTGKTLDAFCDDCGTIWVLAVLPMDVDKVARLGKGAACPSCASHRVSVWVGEKA